MSRHDDTITLRQMLDHIEEAVSLAKNSTCEDLESNRWTIVTADFVHLARQIKELLPDK